jgi:hypothetical protein
MRWPRISFFDHCSGDGLIEAVSSGIAVRRVVGSGDDGQQGTAHGLP